MRVLNSAQMREADRRTIEEIGIPSLVLMENAGRQVVAAMEAVHGDLQERQVAVLCGRGNNGGDGFVVARTLLQRGVDVSVFVLGTIADVRGDARINLEILGRLGLTAVEVDDEPGLGTSLLRSLELHADRRRDVRHRPVRAADRPARDRRRRHERVRHSDRRHRYAIRLSADTHEPIGDSIEADVTITLGAPKLALVLPPAETRAGDIVIADIGIPTEVDRSD